MHNGNKKMEQSENSHNDWRETEDIGFKTVNIILQPRMVAQKKVIQGG